MAQNGKETYTPEQGFAMPLDMRRTNPLPLDDSEVWDTFEKAQDYATNDPTSYVGQILTVIAKSIDGTSIVTSYRIEDETGTLKQIATGDEINMDEITEKDIDDILFSVFGA